MVKDFSAPMCFAVVVASSYFMYQPVGSEVAWSASDTKLDPNGCQICYKNISTAIFPLPLIQEEQ